MLVFLRAKNLFQKFFILALKNIPCSKKTTVGATLVVAQMVAQMVALVKKNLNYKGRYKTCPYKIHLPLTFGVFCKTPLSKIFVPRPKKYSLFFLKKHLRGNPNSCSRWLPSNLLGTQRNASCRGNPCGCPC